MEIKCCVVLKIEVRLIIYPFNPLAGYFVGVTHEEDKEEEGERKSVH